MAERDADHIDPTHILTPVDVERMLARALRRLEDDTAAFHDIQIDAAKAEAAYRRAKGYKTLAIIRHDGKLSAIERDARIELELHDERETHLITQARLHAARESLNSLRMRIEALRTISASVRHQAG